jgi:AcrR family transcriptional regulator
MDLMDNNDFPKDRILNEAEALFAAKGYRDVSVREITKAAKCNLAAVNYHFGNKENLYIEVFRSRWVPRARRIQKHFRDSLVGRHAASATALLRALAQAFLEGPLSDEERQRHVQLMHREITQPTGAFDMVAEEVMRPFFSELAAQFRPFIPQSITKDSLLLNIMGIFAMILHFNFARVAVTRVTGREYDPGFKSQLVEHIVEFSLRGLGIDEKKESR